MASCHGRLSAGVSGLPLAWLHLPRRPEQLAQLSKAAAAAAAAAQDQPLAAHTLPLDCITLPECTIDELQILTGATAMPTCKRCCMYTYTQLHTTSAL